MKASVLDLRRRMKEILRALDRKEPVTILYRGKEKAVLYPSESRGGRAGSVAEHAAFGMWKDRDDMRDVKEVVRNFRKGRSRAL